MDGFAVRMDGYVIATPFNHRYFNFQTKGGGQLRTSNYESPSEWKTNWGISS